MSSRFSFCFDMPSAVCQQFLVLLALAIDLAHQVRGLFGMQCLKRQIFQFAANLAHAQTVRDRRIDVDGLLRDRSCFSRGSEPIVRMLCSRSASFTMMTRMSLVIASSILRRLSACRSSRFAKLILLSLVTPSTQRATSSPNFSRNSSSWSACLPDVVQQARSAGRPCPFACRPECAPPAADAVM